MTMVNPAFAGLLIISAQSRFFLILNRMLRI